MTIVKKQSNKIIEPKKPLKKSKFQQKVNLNIGFNELLNLAITPLDKK